MTLIITNSRLALDMSDLELRARQGDPFAQEELERQCMKASRAHHDPMNSATERVKRAVRQSKR